MMDFKTQSPHIPPTSVIDLLVCNSYPLLIFGVVVTSICSGKCWYLVLVIIKHFPRRRILCLTDGYNNESKTYTDPLEIARYLQVSMKVNMRNSS